MFKLTFKYIFDSIINKFIILNNAYIVGIANKGDFFSFIYFLKNYYFFFNNISLLDIYVIDYPDKLKRFEINYNFLIYDRSFRIFLKFYLKEYEFFKSIDSIFFSSNWFEREIFDLFGIIFENNNNLKKILNDYGFIGFPLRKDYPLTGFSSIKYKNYKKIIFYNNLELNQEFRKYVNIMPWAYNKNY